MDWILSAIKKIFQRWFISRPPSSWSGIEMTTSWSWWVREEKGHFWAKARLVFMWCRRWNIPSVYNLSFFGVLICCLVQYPVLCLPYSWVEYNVYFGLLYYTSFWIIWKYTIYYRKSWILVHHKCVNFVVFDSCSCEYKIKFK